MKFFPYICNRVALDTGMCEVAYLARYLVKSINNTTFAMYSVLAKSTLGVRAIH